MADVRLTRLTGGPGDGECGNNDCPNVYATDRGTFVVQGDIFNGFAPPSGEATVEIPQAVLREAVRVLGW